MSKPQNSTKYFSINDLINTAISKTFNHAQKKKETTEICTTIINDMTYLNIWNSFCKWCHDQTELGFLLIIFPLGNMFHVNEKGSEGISLKFSDMFLKENDLKWDENKFYFEKLPEEKFNASSATIQKLNLLHISSELNLPKIYVQTGLNNIFKAIGSLLNQNFNCCLDIGSLGNLHCLNKTVYHVTSKIKKQNFFNKKASVKSLLFKSNTNEIIDAKGGKNMIQKKITIKNFQNLNNNKNNNELDNISEKKNFNFGKTMGNFNFNSTGKDFKNMGNTQREIFNNLNNSNIQSSADGDSSKQSIKIGDFECLQKIKGNIKFMNTTFFRNEHNKKNSYDAYGNSMSNNSQTQRNFNPYGGSQNQNQMQNQMQMNKTSRIKINAKAKTTNDFYKNNNNNNNNNNYNVNNPNMNNTNSSNFYNNNNGEVSQMSMTNMSKQVNVPFNDNNWKFKDMMNNTFRRKDKIKQSSHPVLFNHYSNTKAAPQTSEKTQIPISHRIASFYSLPLQSFIIDPTNKTLKKLSDEYFLKYKNTKYAAIPATEEEEYLNLLGLYNNNDKVEYRKLTYERYQNYILKFIPDEVIAEIKEIWLVNIIKMSMRPYDLSDPEKYNIIFSEFLKDILHIYKISIKQSIIDYILRHPEQREKLGIPILFKRIKEYAEFQVVRPSDDNWSWKQNWNVSKIRISNNLMIMGENITKIQKYFVKNLKEKSYLDIPKEYDNYTLSSFIDNQKVKIEAQKNFVQEDWRKFVEATLKENKLYKDQMIIYFKSISGVMSTELRKTIIKSLENFNNFISLYKQERYFEPDEIFEGQFSHEFPFQKSFLEISINPSPEEKCFVFSDDLSEVQSKIVSMIGEVVRCSNDCERPDNQFIKNLEKRNNLWEVPMEDVNILKIIRNIDKILRDNLSIVNKCIDLYDPFIFALSEQNELEKFKSTKPRRDEIKKRIAFYEEKLKIVQVNMPNALHMNMIKIDCTEINVYLCQCITEFIYDLLRYVQSDNINGKSKELNFEIENLITDLKMTPKDEEELYLLENRLESYKNDIVPNISSNYADFLEWVFFYYDYDKYQIFPDSNKINDTTMGTIETIVRTSHHTIKLIWPAMETFENVLKEKRVLFEKSLLEYQKEYNNRVEALRLRVEEKRKMANLNLHLDGIYMNSLKDDNKEINEMFNLLNILTRKEELIGAYPTEGEKLENIKKDLDPLIMYFNFLVEYKEITQCDFVEIRNLDFSKLQTFCERGTDVMENHAHKLSNLKQSVKKKAQELEIVKYSTEACKAIYSLIELLKYDLTANDNKDLFDENRVYCMEFTKLIYNHEKGQDYLKGLKFNEFFKNPQNIEKYKDSKTEVDKIVEEWENVKSNYDLMSKMLEDVNINFELENFKDKKFVVISKKNYETIRQKLDDNLKILGEAIEKNSNLKYSDISYQKLMSLKNTLLELCTFVENLEIAQGKLENNMIRANVLQKKADSFMKLKQAESFYKLIIEFILEHLFLMDILKVRESLNENIDSLNKALLELPFSNLDENEVVSM